MKSSTLKMTAFALLVVSAIACGKKGSDGASVSARDNRVSGPMLYPTGTGSPGAVGTIQFSNTQAAQMREAVQVLVSATMDPEAVGDITAIEVSGNIGFQTNGQITNDSAFQIVIKDTYVGQNIDGSMIEPIIIRISNATGTVSNGQAKVTFSDSYGTITVNGTWDQTSGQFQGAVAFQNRVAKVGTKTGGTLGSFVMPTCSLFRCLAQ